MPRNYCVIIRSETMRPYDVVFSFYALTLESASAQSNQMQSVALALLLMHGEARISTRCLWAHSHSLITGTTGWRRSGGGGAAWVAGPLCVHMTAHFCSKSRVRDASERGSCWQRVGEAVNVGSCNRWEAEESGRLTAEKKWRLKWGGRVEGRGGVGGRLAFSSPPAEESTQLSNLPRRFQTTGSSKESILVPPTVRWRCHRPQVSVPARGNRLPEVGCTSMSEVEEDEEPAFRLFFYSVRMASAFCARLTTQLDLVRSFLTHAFCFWNSPLHPTVSPPSPCYRGKPYTWSWNSRVYKIETVSVADENDQHVREVEGGMSSFSQLQFGLKKTSMQILFFPVMSLHRELVNE